MEQKIEISRSDQASDLLARLDYFRKTSKHCDFIIRAGEKEMPVHRLVVCASSEYFDAMLSHDTKENNEGVVEMKEVDPDCVAKCVDFMYTGEAAVAEEKQQDLIHVAHMLQLKRLYNGIAVFLEKKLDCSSFYSTREIAKRYDCEKLVKNCNEFAFKNFRALAKLEDFRKLEVNYIDFLLSSGNLKEPDPIKCKALMMWINHDSNRAASLFALMKNIDFSNVSIRYRRFLIENEPAVVNSMECQIYVMKPEFVNGKTKATDVSLDPTPGIIVFDSKTERLKCFDLREQEWIQMHAMHQSMKHQNCSAVMLDDFIYVFAANLTTLRLDYRNYNASWKLLAKRQGNWGPTVVLNGMIYATEYQNRSNRVERYNPSRNQWSFVPNRLTTLSGSAVVVAAGRASSSQTENLFLLGGMSYDYVSDVVEQFDPVSSSWSMAPSLRNGRHQASATTLNGAIYIFGGGSNYSSVQNVEILFPNANAWHLITLSNFSCQKFNSCSADGKIYLVGNENSDSRTIDEYDANGKKSKTVAKLDSMNVPYFSSVAVVI